MDHLRQFPHLRSKSKTFASIWRIRYFISCIFIHPSFSQLLNTYVHRHGLQKSIHKFFEQHQFLQTNTPIITGNDCEGAGEAFRIVSSLEEDKDGGSQKSFFKKPAFATVSSQLHLEFLASSLSRVYTLGPCFRAEPSDSTRHLVYIYMLF